MKNILIFNMIFFVTIAFAQGKLISKTGKITFEASIPSYEEVTAVNDGVTCVLKLKNGEISSLALMKGFRFKLPLMEQHFNNNYIESDDYPKATFKGVIEGFNWYIIGTTPKEFKMKGKLEIHGKSKEINTIVFLRKIEGALEIKANFYVNSDDFNIEIPDLLSEKVSKKVNIKTLFVVK